MMDMEFDIATDPGAETAVTPIRGGEENPHLTDLEALTRSPLTKSFSNKYRGNQTSEAWLEHWLGVKHVVFGCSPKQAIKNGRLNEVRTFMERATNTHD